jgi:hypothetical protein
MNYSKNVQNAALKRSNIVPICKKFSRAGAYGIMAGITSGCSGIFVTNISQKNLFFFAAPKA